MPNVNQINAIQDRSRSIVHSQKVIHLMDQIREYSPAGGCLFSQDRVRRFLQEALLRVLQVVDWVPFCKSSLKLLGQIGFCIHFGR